MRDICQEKVKEGEGSIRQNLTELGERVKKARDIEIARSRERNPGWIRNDDFARQFALLVSPLLRLVDSGDYNLQPEAADILNALRKLIDIDDQELLEEIVEKLNKLSF